MTEIVPNSVMFTAEGIEVTFMAIPDDVRSDQQVIATRSYAIFATHPTYGEEVRDIQQAVVELIEDVHRDFNSLPISTVPDDEDDLEGMGE